MRRKAPVQFPGEGVTVTASSSPTILEKRSLLVGKRKAWLLIAVGILTGLVAGAGLGRYVLNVPTTPAGSASPATQDNMTNDVSCFDTSEHKVSFVTVEPDVQLEVLDWGG